MRKSLNNQHKLFNNLIFISSICFALFGVNIAQLKAQQINDLTTPLNVQEPTNKQDFVEQCSSNVQAQAPDIPVHEAQNYCQCSADVVYKQLSNGSLSEATVLEDLLKCRQEKISS